ncbi:hypothetical protein DICPUDRAFT_26662 [Dictyostelium purpureum]|uniref:DUF4282 domain-containing protein n=1 Tax=Dictyostelium purpureum TaxID=5786 RepID=F0Z8Y5_DICPU|nr:uncharacterized protein DICPUDRAFT_26662 [Dictyostelium purpureum]EGC39543.1 hypothetical protein DICPUDRAFT_26662 [Dictyostelium purpureum]|eukprot:XP_003283878.1 hypothetical protein DICPUDRAFT_26662 [Dictyostelium purpureum]
MSQFGNYVALGGGHESAPFPESSTNWKELIYFRSWQAQGLVSIFYYFSLVVGLIMLISTIVTTAIAGGVGGFFLGLLYGIIEFVLIIIGARISSELILSVFDMRDSVHRFSNSNGPTIVTGNPSNSTYQQPSYQQSSYQQSTFQSPQQTQQPVSNQNQTSYQEPYQGNL